MTRRLSLLALCLVIAITHGQMMMRQTSQNSRFMPRMAPIMRQPAMSPPFKPIRRALGYNIEEQGNDVGLGGSGASVPSYNAGSRAGSGGTSIGSQTGVAGNGGTAPSAGVGGAVDSSSVGGSEAASGSSSSAATGLETTLSVADTGSTSVPSLDSAGVEGGSSASTSELTTRVAPTVPEFNSALLGGPAGEPGLKLRLNPPFWVHADHHVAPLLNDKIKNAQIPNIHQCLPQFNGCLQVSDVKVTNFRCAERITIRPQAPNQLAISVRNLDVGANANLAGRVSLYIAVPITGNIQLNLRRVSLNAAISITIDADGTPQINVASCHGRIGDADIHIQNGGTIGQLANGQFQPQFAKALRRMLPKQLCQRLPGLLQDQLGGLAEILPKSVPLSEIFSTAKSLIGLGDSAETCPATCPGAGGATTVDVSLSEATTAVPFKARSFRISKRHHVSPARALAAVTAAIRRLKKSLVEAYAGNEKPAVSSSALSSSAASTGSGGAAGSSAVAGGSGVAVSSSGVEGASSDSIGASSGVDSSASVASLGETTVASASDISGASAVEVTAASLSGSDAATVPSDAGLDASSTTVDPACASCGGPSGFINALVGSLDMEKAKRILLSIKILQAFATKDVFAVAVNGEFSPNGRGGTPFTAFPMDFPTPNGNDRMAEILLSDFTINSALYHLHKVGFLNVKLTPETPTVGPILKTSCGLDEDFEDTGVELDEATTAAPDTLESKLEIRRIIKRQNLAELGVCLGTAMPSLSEKYPHKKVIINGHTITGPSVQFRADNGGTVHVELAADADISLEDTGEHVGTIRVDTAIDIQPKNEGGKLTASAEITRLNLTDPTGKLGLPQDTLDSLGSLGKDTIQNMINEMLGKGKSLEKVEVNLGVLPLTLEHVKMNVLSHALHVSADANIADENFAALGFNVNTEEVCSTRPGETPSRRRS